MKGKRGKNEKPPKAAMPGEPFESLLPEAQVNNMVIGRSSGSFQYCAPSR